jgi:hypothetical protein
MNADKAFYRQAWQVVAKGGWWSPSDILEELPIGLELERDDFHTRIWYMHRNGYFTRRGEPRAYQYAVTETCRVPQGLTVKQVSACLVGERA